MIKVHHLNNSRSHRILWLLEEMGLPYEIISHQRDHVTRLAPPELKAIHPLGKSPVIVDGPLVVAESGAIIEYLIDTYGKGRFKPAAGSAEYVDYLHWLHFAEGSAMLPLMLALYVGLLGDAGASLQPRISSELQNHLGYMNDALGDRPFFVGNSFTGADIQLAYVAEAANSRKLLDAYPNLKTYLERIHARPAYQAALAKGGPVALNSRA